MCCNNGLLASLDLSKCCEEPKLRRKLSYEDLVRAQTILRPLDVPKVNFPAIVEWDKDALESSWLRWTKEHSHELVDFRTHTHEATKALEEMQNSLKGLDYSHIHFDLEDLTLKSIKDMGQRLSPEEKEAKKKAEEAKALCKEQELTIQDVCEKNKELRDVLINLVAMRNGQIQVQTDNMVYSDRNYSNSELSLDSFIAENTAKLTTEALELRAELEELLDSLIPFPVKGTEE